LSNSHHDLRQNMGLGAMLVLCTGVMRAHPFWRAALFPVALAGLGFVATADGRGMKVGLGVSILVVLVLGFGRRAGPMSVRLLALLLCGMLGALLVPLVLDMDAMKLFNLDRFADADPAAAQGTAYWRQIWWRNIFDAVLKANPVFGLGFGQNLSIYNPFLTAEDLQQSMPVRSPHNFNVTVFARMGIAGAFLWLATLGLGVGTLVRQVWRGGHSLLYSPERLEELSFWVLMLICTWLNSSFGVLMEGPVLGVWFWFALGFASRRALPALAEHAGIHAGRSVPFVRNTCFPAGRF
jgi:O-antigen ligase